MKSLDKVLKDMGYTQQTETSYSKGLKDSHGNYTGENITYYYQNNCFAAKFRNKVSAEEWKARCLHGFGEKGYSLLGLSDMALDTDVIIYDYTFDFYFVYSYKKVGFGGFAEYSLLKDGNNYDILNSDFWDSLPILKEDASNCLKVIDSLVYINIDKQGGLSGTVSGKEVYYNPDIINLVNSELELLKDDVKKIIPLNICEKIGSTLCNDIFDAIHNDDYKSLVKICDEDQYINGVPIIYEAIDSNSFKIIDKLLKNKKCINQTELMYKGGPVNYAILRIKDKEKRLKYLNEFIKNKCDYNSKDVFNRNLLYDAIQTNDDEIFDVVFNLKNIEIDNTPCDKILFGSVDTPPFVDLQRFYTPLQYACKHENLYAVKKMVNKKNVNLANMVGSCLFNAITSKPNTSKKYEVIEYLLKMGADPNWKYENEITYQNLSIDSILKQVEDSDKIIKIIKKYSK